MKFGLCKDCVFFKNYRCTLINEGRDAYKGCFNFEKK